jgi:anti-sigma B factor antagonist
MQVQERDGVVVVTVLEEQCTALWKTLEPFIEAGKRSCVLDMNEVSFLNSVNIAAIIATRNKLVALGGKVAVANIKDRVKSIFRVLKLDRLFDLNRTLDTAIGAVR